MTSFFQMLLFPMVESIVGGPATAWPRVILDFLFARPTDRSLMASTTLAAFFFGNNVPCALALPLLELCMDLNNSDPFLQAVYDLYNAWANTATTTRVCAFYDVRLAHHRWLNAPYGPHTAIDPAEGPTGSVLLGFERRPDNVAMRTRLFYARVMNHVF